MNKTVSISLDQLSAYSNSADALKKALGGVPSGATYRIGRQAGDRPWESETFTITFEWKESL